MLNDTLPAWKALKAHAATISKSHLRDLIATPGRFDDCTLRLPGLMIDYSRQRIDSKTLRLLLDLAESCDISGWRAKMFDGAAINTTEGRAVLHTALRRPRGDVVKLDGHDIIPGIHATLDRMKAFTESVHSGQWAGHSGKQIKTIINIGIGGSDLGPRMVVDALCNFHVPGFSVRFVSNVDGADLYNTLRDADPETTLFLIASKTFTTQETMANAATAKDWLLAHYKDEAATGRHFVALSTNAKAVAAFGIDAELMFPFDDWVGGRYSLWSSIGLSIALAVGFDHFRALLDGAHVMDRHFQSAPAEKNAPILLALLGVWNRNFLDLPNLAVLPYAQNLALFTKWLQQVDMESNGKSVTRDGDAVTFATGPTIFGTQGTDCQHSYFQLIHQGTDIIPCDFIATLKPDHPWPAHHTMLLANLVAQADALAHGRSLAESGGDPARSFAGNRPSTILLADQLDPMHLGQLLALYEHKTFVQGALWGINSFDQWGVELGKILANKNVSILQDIDKKQESGILTHIKKRLFS